MVTFTAPATGASGSFATSNTAVTNASGTATSHVFTANATAGSYSVTAAVAGLSGTASFSLSNTAGTAASITATGGTPQSAIINTAFGSPLQATVKDSGGNPLSGVTVTFTAPATGASGSFATSNTAITNASGIATSTVFTANGTAGSYSVTAAVAGLSGTASFSLSNTVGTAASITATGGTPQSATINTAFGSPLQATVKDSGGNPLSGVTVTFTAPGTGASGSFATSNTAVTNASGIATSTGFTANGTAGSYSVTAAVSGLSGAASFSLSNTVGTAASITATGGTPQSATINTAFGLPLQATVKDSGGNPLSGVTVTFTAPATGASGSFATSNIAMTNASGIATSTVFTANATAGSYSVTAAVAGLIGGAGFSLSNTAGTAASITGTGGTPQSATINTAFGSPLQATVKDSGGNPLSGVTVTFTAPGTGASGSFATSNTAVTNASGIATSHVFTANGTAGSYNVTAAFAGLSATASFSLSNTAGTASSITATGGTPQSATINTAFGSPLQATVKDSGGNPLGGVTVTFTAPGTGAAGSFATSNTAITNASGIATSSVFTANGTAGSYSVTAAVAGLSGTASFSLSNTAATAASIAATGGTPQSALINTAFGSPLQATVKDSGGNPLSGVTVTFTLPATGAGASFASSNTAVTNARGIATSSTLTANASAGSYSVIASVSGVATTASYSLTNKTGAATSITATAGTPQSAPINTAFGVALQATVRDAGNNPVQGITVTFTAPNSGASGSFASNGTAITNASGVASAPAFTANGTSGPYTVAATAAGVTGSTSFSLTNTVGTPTSIAVSSGSGQTTVIQTTFGSTLQVVVKDAGRNPVAGVTVTFTVPASGASATFGSGNTAVTNASGIATSSVITANNTVGSYTVKASISGVSSTASFSLTNTVGTVSSITAIAGTPQSAVIDSSFASALQVAVKDAGGNPVPGVTVTFAASASGASASFANGNTAVTNASGLATSSALTANATAGSYNVTATVAGVSGSASFSLSNTVGSAASVSATAGTPQSATINTAFSAVLQATVKDAGGNPVGGVTVTFALPSSGASATIASGTTAVTNANGVATSSILTANAIAGSYTVRASVVGVNTSTSFSLTNTTGTPASIVATAGTSQSTTISTAFATALQATVKDAGGNPISGVTVTFALPGSGASASFSNGNTAISNANGVATASTLTANSVSGAYTVTASVTGLASTATFSLTNAVGSPASIATVLGTPQSALINTAFSSALQAIVTDAGGNPVSGVTVNFALPTSGATAIFSNGNTAVTNTNGIATSSTLTADATAGSYNVTATTSGVASAAYYSLTNKTGVAASVTVYSGSLQSAQISTAFANSLIALIRDSGGNPVSGVSVTFTSPGASDGTFTGALVNSAAMTNASGLATAPSFTAGITAASYNVTATVSGVSTSALFALTNTPGAASAITATSGAGQSATILTAFTTNLQATVKDGSGNPVSGASVTFTSASSSQGTFAGGVLTSTASTNASGVATAAVFTAGTSAGSYNVSAAATGVSGSTTFYLTNTPGPANNIIVNSGSGQSTIIGTAFSSRLQALVRDSHNNAVSGVTVTFTPPSSGPSGTLSGNVTTATTDANGFATSAIFTANSTAGAYSVTATASGVTGSAGFSLTNTPGTSASIATYSSSSESTPVGTAFPSNLQAIVRDSGGNVVSGVTVTFAPPTSGASGSFAGGVTTATTNTSGIATAATFTANATPGSYQVTASVAGVSSPAAFTLTNTQGIITSISPNQGVLGQTLNVVVTGSASHFTQGTTTAYFGTGITVNAVNVTSQTAATVNITISPTTTLGYRFVSLTTGSEVATDSNAFYVAQGSAAIASINPTSGAQGTQANVTVTGSQTNFQQGVSMASFGNDIGINSITVTDLTHATVNVSIGANATLGTQTITLTTGGEVASLANAFTITSGQSKITVVNPSTGHQGDTGDSIILTGQSSHFVQGTTTASFGSGVTVSSLMVNSPTSATAVISIDSAAATGNRTVTLTTGSETASSATNGFVVAAGVPTATANPNFGIQGANPTLVINGSFTSFVQGVTTVSFNDNNIMTGTVTVNGPTQLSVPVQIGTNANVGTDTIIINTNDNLVYASFNVVAGMPNVILINPNVGVPNSTVSVHITGNFTHWINGSTKVSFGDGIAVGGGVAGKAGPVVVNNSGDITASIAIGSSAALGPRTVTVTTGSEVESVSSGFTVQTCSTTETTVISSTPAASSTNVPVNSIFQAEFSAPVDRNTANSFDFYIYDPNTGTNPAGTTSIDASGRILTFIPDAPFAVGRSYYTEINTGYGGKTLDDTCGSGVNYFSSPFTTAFSTDTSGPSLIANSPLQGDVLPENVNVVLQFSEPINPITQPAGIVVSTGGVAVAGTYTPSPDYTQFTFVPGAPLSANTTYTVTTSSSLQDGAANALVNPGSFTLTTNSATDTSNGSILYTDPYYNETNVQTGIHPTVYFSKVIDPITINSSNFYLVDAVTSRRIPATVAVSADRLSEVLTPQTALQPNTEYYFYTGSALDLAGNYIYSQYYYFYTGGGPSTTAATITSISPAKGTTGAPINTRVIAITSAPLDGGSVNNATITLKAGTNVVPGTTTIDTSVYQTLTFVPSSDLSPSTTYTATISGLLDANELAVATVTTSFTTSSSTADQTNFNFVSSTPADGDTNVANNATITLTFSSAVDPTSISNILIRDASNSYQEISGTFAVSPGNPAQVIFTPATLYPANASINIYTNGYIFDLAGNTAYANITFTVTGTADTTALKVISVSPANGTTGVGRNPSIVLTFNKSVDRSTINSNTNALQLFAGDTNIGLYNVTYSADGRSITFNPYYYYYNALPPSSVINVNATSLIKDLSGNPLVNFTSQFTTASDIPTSGPSVVQMIPANGSSDVLQNTPITLYLNGSPLNPASVTSNTFHVSQNGTLIQGTIAVSSGGQSILFTPASSFAYGALVQVFLDPSVTDIYGNPLSSGYSGQFTIQGNPSTVAPVMIGSSPLANATNVPLNVLPQMKFDQPLLASSVDNTSVFLFNNCTGQTVPGTAGVIGDGSVIQFTPSGTLTATCNGAANTYYLQINNQTKQVTNLDGVAVSSNPYFYLTVGSAAVNTSPTVVSIAPPASAQNVGINAVLYLQFSEIIDPFSISSATVKIAASGQTGVPETYSLDSTGTLAIIQPEIPLPANTQLTVTVSGVTDTAGNAVTPYTSIFTTGSLATTSTPAIINESIPYNTTNVPTNAVVTVQFDQPMAANSFTSSSFYLNDNLTGLNVPATIALGADGTTASLTPTAPLSVNRQYYYAINGVRGISGNTASYTSFYFTTESVQSSVLPLVLTVNPANNLTNVPTNVIVQLQFNEPIAPDTVSQVSINLNGSAIPATRTFDSTNTILTLTPSGVLQANTVYTITAVHVVDHAGHTQSTAFSSTFTTGATADVVYTYTLSSTIPNSGDTNVATNVHPTVFFANRINPISLPVGSFFIRDSATGATIPSTFTVAANQLSATLTPQNPLQPDTLYSFYFPTTTDITGNPIYGTSFSFTTGTASTTTGATVTSISPPNGQTAVPLNATIIAVLSQPITQATLPASPITVTAGSTVVPGTITLAGDQVTLTFTPTAALAAGTTYSVSVGGFQDQNGNTVQTFTSTFKTGSAAEAGGSFSVLSITPGDGTTISKNTTPIVLTFSDAIDPATISSVLVRDQNDGYAEVAGTWSVNGTVATFTPLSPYPANHSINVYTNGYVYDLAGETAYSYTTFTAANTADTTAPKVTSVTPANGAASVGNNPPIVLTFSKSINPSTVTTSTVSVFAGDKSISNSITNSGDGRTFSINTYGTLPPTTEITVSASAGVQDLSGNALTPFQSQFTTGAAPIPGSQAPTVVSQIPGSGATDISQSTVVTLYTAGTPIDSSTLNSNSFQLSANGQLVSGSIALSGNGHAIEFTPSAPLPYGALIQVFLNTLVMDTSGYPLSSAYSGQFTIQGNPASADAQMTGSNPVASSSNVALNVIPQIQFDQKLLSSSLNASSVYLYDYCAGQSIAGTISLGGNGTNVQFKPAADLTTDCPYFYFYINGGAGGVTDVDGVPVSSASIYFYTSSSDDTTHPTVTAIGPPSGTKNVGINAEIFVQFSKPINPLTATASTIAITAGSQTIVPASISFNSTNSTVTVVPSAPLPASTTLTVKVSGVTDPEGNTVTAKTSTFTTGTSPDTTSASVVATSIVYGDTIPVNTTAFSVTYNEPLDPTSVNSITLDLYDYSTGGPIAGGTVTASSDMMTLILNIPANQLVAGNQYALQSNGTQDLAGNTSQGTFVYFTAGTTSDTTAPTVIEVNPLPKLTNVPTNSLPQIEFSKEISAVSAQTGIELLQGTIVVPATITLSEGDTVATITPNDPLAENTKYTLSASGVQDIQGTALATAYTSTFTTSSTGISLSQPSLLSVTPADGTINVSANVTPKLVFSAAMDPITFDASLGYFLLRTDANDVAVPATLSFSADGKTLTVTPASPLTSGTTYDIYVYFYYLTDVAGNTLNYIGFSSGYYSTFTVQ